MIIKIADEYTKIPGGRYRSDGPFSGEQFKEEVLAPAFSKALAQNETLTVDLDGGYGYGSSFLDEAFGGLARDLHDCRILDIRIISEEEPELVDNIKSYIKAGLEEK